MSEPAELTIAELSQTLELIIAELSQTLLHLLMWLPRQTQDAGSGRSSSNKRKP